MTLIVEDFYGALTRLADEIAAQATSRRGFCPTGQGGGIDNSCGTSKGGAGSGDGGSGAGGGDPGDTAGGKSGGVRDEAFDRWRDRDSSELGSVRKRIESTQEIADQIASKTRDKLDKLSRERANARDAREGLKEQSKATKKKLEETAMEHADPELKARLEKMDPIRRELFLTKNKQSDPRVEAARQERLEAQSRVQESAAKLAELSRRIDQEEEFAASITKDARVTAWREIAAYSAQTATSGIDDDGDAYSQELFDKAKSRFSGEMQSMFVTGKASPEDFKRFEEGPKREAAEFLSTVVNPATLSSDSMRNANLNVDNIDRAYASGDTVHVSPYSSSSTVIHELGHIYEGGDPSMREAAAAFHRHRCDESQNVKMREVTGNAGYSDSEVGNYDDFRKVVEAVYKSSDPYEDADVQEARIKSRSAYLGKAYKGEDGSTRATELVSIGLEMMHHNPSAFAKADPEYFDFMLGVVSGKIRRVRKRKA
jgi:hypothetical protein